MSNSHDWSSVANVDVGLKIECANCKVDCWKGRFSKNQMKKYQASILRERRGQGQRELPLCRECNPGNVVELTCSECRVTKSLDFFSNQQRHKPDDAKCRRCQQEIEDRVPFLDDALEEERIREESRRQARQRSTLPSVSGSVTGSHPESQAQSTTGDGVYVDAADGGSAWGASQASVRSPSPTAPTTSYHTPSTYSAGSARNSFHKQGAYKAPVHTRVMNQIQREEIQKQESQLGSRREESDDDDVGAWEL